MHPSCAVTSVPDEGGLGASVIREVGLVEVLGGGVRRACTVAAAKHTNIVKHFSHIIAAKFV